MDKDYKIFAAWRSISMGRWSIARRATAAVDNALYALELPMAGEERVVTWIGNGADVLIQRALTWARQERAALRAAQGKPSVDHDDIPQAEQQAILRKLFDRYYGEVAEEGFLFPAVADTLGALHAKACRWRW